MAVKTFGQKTRFEIAMVAGYDFELYAATRNRFPPKILVLIRFPQSHRSAEKCDHSGIGLRNVALDGAYIGLKYPIAADTSKT